MLADTIQTSDTLFQQIRVERQIEHHHFAGKLEVTAFGADFRTQQNLRAIFLRSEVRGGAVTFNDRQTFMEHSGADRFTLTQNLLQLQRGGGFGTDNQHFLVAVGGQITEQPFHTRVEVPPRRILAFEFLINLLRIEHVVRTRFGGFFRAHDA